MHSDILDLMHFYNSPLGRIAQHLVLKQIRRIWPQAHGQRILGLGYATPYLKAFEGEAERIIAAMPATQGIAPWPEGARNRAALCHDCNLPFEDYSIDRVLLMHGLEGCNDPFDMLQEIWRVLSGDGRVLMVVPNRLGLWARFDHTPFGTGQPYSATQLGWALRRSLFTPVRTARALYTPPTQSRVLLSWSRGFEKIGPVLFNSFSGLLLIEAKKEVYAAHGQRYRRNWPAYGIFPGTPTPVTPPKV